MTRESPSGFRDSNVYDFPYRNKPTIRNVIDRLFKEDKKNEIINRRREEKRIIRLRDEKAFMNDLRSMKEDDSELYGAIVNIIYTDTNSLFDHVPAMYNFIRSILPRNGRNYPNFLRSQDNFKEGLEKLRASEPGLYRAFLILSSSIPEAIFSRYKGLVSFFAVLLENYDNTLG